MIWKETEIEEGSIIRTFSEEIDPIDLQWHRDGEDREIVSIEESDWMIQLENQLPISLNSPVFIKRGEWHRLIKGNNELIVKIVKG